MADDSLWEAIRRADDVRSRHNGITSVELTLRQGGENWCKFREGDAVVGEGHSNWCLLEAVRQARDATFRARYWSAPGRAMEVAGMAAIRHRAELPPGAIRPTPGFFTSWDFQRVVHGAGHYEPGLAEVAAILAAESRVVRLDSGYHWMILPAGHARHPAG